MSGKYDRRVSAEGGCTEATLEQGFLAEPVIASPPQANEAISLRKEIFKNRWLRSCDQASLARSPFEKGQRDVSFVK